MKNLHLNFKKTVLVFLLFAVALGSGGCFSIARRLQWEDESPKPLYIGTRANFKYLRYIFLGEGAKEGECATGRGCSLILFPLTLVPLPFDIVFDTICLPYDIPVYFSEEPKLEDSETPNSQPENHP
ncbi:MAG: YceK/YidQ family lipoprotein [Puniceicoccales bacterium]|jgi:uncharacterized protein YceK|nr:YceK/YidQ family lipoprotein [Puniceicoccales bacterium]